MSDSHIVDPDSDSDSASTDTSLPSLVVIPDSPWAPHAALAHIQDPVAYVGDLLPGYVRAHRPQFSNGPPLWIEIRALSVTLHGMGYVDAIGFEFPFDRLSTRRWVHDTPKPIWTVTLTRSHRLLLLQLQAIFRYFALTHAATNEPLVSSQWNTFCQVVAELARADHTEDDILPAIVLHARSILPSAIFHDLRPLHPHWSALAVNSTP
ncbi:hypothetical protein OH76DRAFT_1480664 [Lentinus brumalis]|uniref:Uncharacterized protein n=1 Tax=Lentinus brumalis TaxID=2498619 RepID=A0A371DJ48_9APHY|nr:hypothetical protein OH76DRAFT_1480664 [Polyporus brumalis]